MNLQKLYQIKNLKQTHYSLFDENNEQSNFNLHTKWLKCRNKKY